MPQQIEREAQRQKERLLKTEQLRARDGPKSTQPDGPELLTAEPSPKTSEFSNRSA